MKEHPIIMSAPSVRGILAGTKTQTRRVIADRNTIGNWRVSDADLSQAWVDQGPSPAGNPGPYLHAPITVRALLSRGWNADEGIVDRFYPRWNVGDKLWVKETWAEVGTCDPGILITRADYPSCVPRRFENIPAIEAIDWRPSIFMSRRASRITLEVTEIRAQHVQEISEDDARAEGVAPLPVDRAFGIDCTNCVKRYHVLWDSINGKKYPWESNPFVWAVSFKTIDTGKARQ